MSRRIASALVCVGLLAAAAQAQLNDRQEGKKNSAKTPARQVSGNPEGSGTVQYDPGSPPDGFLISPTPSYFGNVFNSRNGAPLSAGTLTRVSWYQGLPPGGTGIFIFLAPPTGTVSADILFATGVASYAFNSGSVNPTVGSSFVVGFEAPSNGAFGSVGMRSASYNSQGFHGQQRSFFGGTTSLPGQNVMVRVSGNIVIPVELTEFEIE